jgi:hypothetical protein
MIKLKKINDLYVWHNNDIFHDENSTVTYEMKRAKAISFGVWWLRLERSQVETGIKMLEETKHNTAFFSVDRGDFLYVDTIEGKS